MRVLFVGINPGVRSSTVGHHFAGYSNRFWKLLHESGIVPAPLSYAEDARLLEWGYGITNLVARPTPGINDLGTGELAAGKNLLLEKIERTRPGVVALVGVTLYRALFPEASPAAARGRGEGVRGKAAREKGGQRRRFPLGLQAENLHGSRVFVLPNPSGRNANFSYAEMLQAFCALKTYLDGECQRDEPVPGGRRARRARSPRRARSAAGVDSVQPRAQRARS